MNAPRSSAALSARVDPLDDGDVGGTEAPAPARAAIDPRNWRLELRRGAEACALLRDRDFLLSWQRVARLDPKSTHFQEPEFALPWYECYRTEWQPALALARTAEGETVGVMALATRPEGSIVHAGGSTAWYHGWACLPEIEGEFPRRAVAQVFRSLPVRRWLWRYLPPGAPTEWLRDLGPAPPAAVRTRVFTTPLWDLSDAEDLARRTGTPSVRNYANRYRRSGELVFERVSDPRAARTALEHLARWANFRLGALHSDHPYRDDPFKLPFHLAAVAGNDRVVLHVLRLDDRLLAVHVGDREGERFFLGMQGHDPAESRMAVANILLYELAKELAEDGVRTLDLTPGGEPWKQRHATHWEEVVRPEFVRSRLAAGVDGAADMARGLVKRALVALGQDPQLLRARLEQRFVAPPGDAAGARARCFEVADAPPERAAGAVAREQAPPTDAVAALLDLANTQAGADAQRQLSKSLYCLGAGWEPLISHHGEAPESVAWLQPDGARVQLPEPGEMAKLLRGNAAAKPPESEAPGDVSVLWVTHLPEPGGSVHAAFDRLLGAARTRCSRRLWVLLDPSLSEFVPRPERARPV